LFPNVDTEKAGSLWKDALKKNEKTKDKKGKDEDDDADDDD
jgi:hypothetical protein